MFDRPVRSVMQRRKILKVPPQTSVRKAAALMANKNVGAVMVIENERLVGIFTERDAVIRVIARGLDTGATRLADVMTPSPHTVGPDKPFGYALLVMHDHGFRHLPVIENGKLIGIVSARSAMDPDLEEFEAEAQRRRYFREQP
jgi:CBS domain-containing protein